MATPVKSSAEIQKKENSASQTPSRTSRLLADLAKAQKSTPSSTANTQKYMGKSTKNPVDAKRKNNVNKNAPLIFTPTKKESTTKLTECRSSQKKSVGARIIEQPPINNKRTRHCSNTTAPRPGPSKAICVQPIPIDVLEEVYFRFIENMPDDEIKSSRIRICFEIELAHWFYVDFFCKQEERSDCPNMGMKDFARQLFNHFAELNIWADQIDEIIDEWRLYKYSVPTYGAIMLDPSLDHVLLVQGYYSSKNSWGFPKGKINENEQPRECAVREVMEETGYDFAVCSTGNEPKIQKFINDAMIRLYIVKDVPVDFPFSPHARNEIRKIQWFNIWDLPADRNEQPKIGSNSNFYMVIPFVADLHNYIRKEKARRQKAASKFEIRPKMESQTSYQLGAVTSIPQSEQQFSSSTLQAFFGPMKQGVSNDSFKNKITNKALPKLGEFTYGPPPIQFETSSENQFRPVNDSTPSGTGDVMRFLTSTSADVTTPVTIAKPVQQKLAIALNKPVYIAPAEKPFRAGKIVCSETSAFTKISATKGPAIHSHQIATVPQGLLVASVAEIEQELQRVFFSDNSRSRSNVKSSATDMSTELVSTCDFKPVLNSVTNIVAPSADWDNFKLDTKKILNDSGEIMMSRNRPFGNFA